MWYRVASIVALLFFAFTGLLTAPIQAQDGLLPFDLERIERATVFIMQMREIAGRQIITCVSSGTIVSRDGLIITNAHSTVTGTDCPGDRLIVALNIRVEDPPVPKYQADLVQYDAGLDLALLRIEREFDGRAFDRSALSLPFVELGDSSRISLDETVTIVGYPGIGDDSVRVVRGTIQGTNFEPNAEEPSWIKVRTDVASGEDISGTMTGGGAYNRNGLLIGIPTTAPLARQAVGSLCRFVQDTNQDDLINQNDSCVPTGGSINALRPSNFARPLIRSGSLGLVVEKLSEPPAISDFSETAPPTITRPLFAPSVSGGMPTTFVTRLPTGSDGLYLFFDYDNMTPETVYELRVTVNGNINPIFSLAPVRWSGGRRGLWYIGSSGQVWPDGEYEFTVFINGVAAAGSSSIVIGGPPDNIPTFRNISFGLLENNQMFGFGYLLAAGQVVNAEFLYDNVPNGTPWSAIWYFEGAPIEQARFDGIWESEFPSGTWTTQMQIPEGLPEGRYRLQLGLDGKLAAMADFTIAGSRVDAFPRIFSAGKFAIATTPEEAITARPMTSFPDRVDTLYALFNWERIAQGTMWQMRWSVDGTVFYDQLVPWRGANSGENFLVRLTGPRGVPDGTYEMQLLMNRVPLVSIQVEIGIGQLPLDLFAQAEGVLLRGEIINADTNQGVPDVTVLMLSEEFSVEDYVARRDQVFAMATTDRNGRFQINRPLQYSVPYSVIIMAEGYLPLTADGFTVTNRTPNPFDMRIYLARD